MKKLTIYFALLLSLLVASTSVCYAQKPTIDYRLAVGFNIGGRAPLDLPAEIRSVNSFAPLLNLTLGGSVDVMFVPKWGLATGLRFEGKGMKTSASVENYQMSMNVSDGDQTGKTSGYFTGNITNETRSDYLTIPVLAVFRPSPSWEVRLGAYFAYSVNQLFVGSAADGYIRENPLMPKIGVKSAEYDFTSDLRRFDAGLEFGADLKIYKSLSVTANMLWGFVNTLNPATRSMDMDMYNIYLNVGFAYRF